ncbi:MAG: hypothetical protein RR061_01950 [Muribaculaceae bacterium]
MKPKISTQIALLLVLLATILVVIFPILGRAALTADENSLLSLAKSLHGSSLLIIFSGAAMHDIITITYAYIVDLLIALFHGNEKFMLRLPSAIVMIILTLSLFRFDGMIERLNKSFFASMLFLSCGLISLLTFNATEITLPALTIIIALMSLYQWMRKRSQRSIMLIILSTSASTIFLGAIAPSLILIIASIFFVSTRLGTFRNVIIIVSTIIVSCLITFTSVYILTGNENKAIDIFGISSNLAYLAGSSENNLASTFLNYVIFAFFPWSIPLIISCFWLFRNPRWIVAHFISLKLLQRFGIVLFLITIPFLFFFTKISLILMVASIFFNMPLVSNYMLSQLTHHPLVWRITGGICAAIVVIGIVIFIVLNNITSIHILDYSISMIDKSINGWCIAIIVFLFISIYTLWRNKRNITLNHRYLYNILIIYLLSQMLYIGFISGNIAII